MVPTGWQAAAPRARAGHLLVAGLLVVLFAAPLVGLSSSYRLSVGHLACYMAILAATWSLLAGVAGQFSFAHVALAGLAGYGGAIWGNLWAPVHPLLGSVGVQILVGTLVAWVVGSLLGLLLLRLRAAYLALFTIAFAEIARLVIVAEAQWTGGRLSLRVMELPGSDLAHYYLLAGLLVVVLAVIYGLLASRTGLFLRAMREEYGAAAAMGVPVTRLKVFIFSFTSALVGLAASVYFHTVPRLVPENLDFLQMSLVIAYAVIGGLEHPLAAAVAAATMTFVLEFLRRIGWGPWVIDLGVWRYAAFGVLVVLTVRFARNGLLVPLFNLLAGEAARRRETVAPRDAAPPPALRTPLDASSPGPGPTARPAAPPTPAAPLQATARRTLPAVVRRGRSGAGRGPIDLVVQDLSMRFGGHQVLNGVSLTLRQPTICGLIGPNGSGKTTLTNLLTGVYQPTGGAIHLREKRVDGLPPYALARRGVGRTFQIPAVFSRLTVLENLLVPGLAAPGSTWAAEVARAREALRFLKLEHLARERARALSGGQKKLLELARLLMLDPDIYILDEPFAGVHPALKEAISAFILELRAQGKALIIIEHDMETIFGLSERLLVLANGRLIADGDPATVRRDRAVIEAYLGREEDEAQPAPTRARSWEEGMADA